MHIAHIHEHDPCVHDIACNLRIYVSIPCAPVARGSRCTPCPARPRASYTFAVLAARRRPFITLGLSIRGLSCGFEPAAPAPPTRARLPPRDCAGGALRAGGGRVAVGGVRSALVDLAR